MEQKLKAQIKNSFDSILRADYLSIDHFEELDNLGNYYIDFFNSVGSILQKQDSYISGRRGTGKTTALLKGYYECLKTIKDGSKSDLISSKILPIYIDLSNCGDIFDKENFELFEIHFVRQIIDSLKRQLESIYDKKTFGIFKKDNPAIDDLEYIERILIEGKTIFKSKNISITKGSQNFETNELGLSVNPTSLPSISFKDSNQSKNYSSETFTSTKGLNVQEFLNKINAIITKAKIDCTYLFLDEFSDLNPNYQKKFSQLLKSFLGSKTSLFIKVAVITDRFDFGDKIIIGRDIFPIPLDLNEHVERLGGLAPTLNKLEISIPNLIQKRLNLYADGAAFDNLIKGDKIEFYRRLARESIGVTRTVGLILQNAWKQAELSDDPRMGLSELSYGIRAARKTYQKQYEGALKRQLIPGFYNDIWNAIIKKALDEKTKVPDRPASHLLIDPNRSKYLNVFKENFLLHLLEEGRSSKYGGHYNLYSIDYDICLDLNIKYAENKDEYTAARFIYDPILSEFDRYLLTQNLKVISAQVVIEFIKKVSCLQQRLKGALMMIQNLKKLFIKNSKFMERTLLKWK